MEQGRGSNSNMSSGGSNESIIYGITLQKRCACCSASNNNSNQKHTAHANSHHKIVHGGYFTLPLFIAIVYVFRTNSYLCAGRVLHSPPAHCHSIRVSYQFVPVRREGTSLSPCCTFQPHNNNFKSNSNASKVGRPFHLR